MGAILSPDHPPDNENIEWATHSNPLALPPEVPFPQVSWDWSAINSVPQIDPTAWVAEGAIIIGRVRLKARSSIWYGCILRGDQQWIEVGEDPAHRIRYPLSDRKSGNARSSGDCSRIDRRGWCPDRDRRNGAQPLCDRSRGTHRRRSGRA